jgi:hypothetical protein
MSLVKKWQYFFGTDSYFLLSGSALWVYLDVIYNVAFSLYIVPLPVKIMIEQNN